MNRQDYLTMQDRSRREFLRLALMSAAFATLPLSSFALDDSETSKATFHGPLRELAPGAILPDGWLQGWLGKQAAGLGSHLPEVSWPFTKDYWGKEQQGDYWTAEQEYEQWWPWEQRAYWIDGAARLAILLRDDALLAKTRQPIEYTLSHPDIEGYLGPEIFEDPLADYHRWPHVVFFRAVAALYDENVESSQAAHRAIPELLKKHYLSDQASYGKPKRNVHNVETILWTYDKTGDPKLLALAEKAWKEYQTFADDPENTDLGAMRVMADTAINAHGETYAECSKQPAILYLYTGKQEYLDFALADQRRIFDHHMLIDGIPSTSEWFSTTTSLDSHETCDIADHTWSWGYMLQATGDAVWADHIERACFNAAPGAIKKDWKALQYLSCPNQFLATLDSDHNWPKFKEHGGGMMAYQPNPGQRTACCAGNVHRIFPNYTMRMWMKTSDGGLAAVLYGPSTVTHQLGPNRHTVKVVQQTNYPFDETIHFTIQCEQPVEFPLSLRIPGWCEAPQLTVNGSRVAVARNAKGFIVLHRTFRPNDVIALTLSMKLKLSRWPQNGIGIERGPLVYSLPIDTTWTSEVEPRYSTPEFPEWEATPSGAWNYGLALDPNKLLAQAVVKISPTHDQTNDPWSNPPIQITVPAKRIQNWTLQSNPENGKQHFTPALPDLQSSQISSTVEHISLVPYGSTHLRITIFPDVSNA